jgi:hypothetical protein
MPSFYTPTINQLIEAIKDDKPIFYHAPTDQSPVLVSIRQYTLIPDSPESSRNRITARAGEFLGVIHLTEHLDRFRLKAKSVNQECA